jgi:hypothetical protein
MPIDRIPSNPDGSDSQEPKPPTNPVEFARWVQRPRVNPKTLLSAIWEKGLSIIGASPPHAPPIATIHKTTAVWASQRLLEAFLNPSSLGQRRVYYGYISPFFRKCSP